MLRSMRTNETQFPVAFTTSFHDIEYRSSPLAYASRVLATSNQQSPYNFLANEVNTLLKRAAFAFYDQLAAQDVGNSTDPVLLSAEMTQLNDGGNYTYPSWWCPRATFETNATCKTAVPDFTNVQLYLFNPYGKVIV
ncbi:hypothetical protein FRB93_013394 [Tulasnella sp. JGI-2019a]|nr:hypothetical protein FRB93_013394 [Tulasnella sp. JGI-2019a]